MIIQSRFSARAYLEKKKGKTKPKPSCPNHQQQQKSAWDNRHIKTSAEHHQHCYSQITIGKSWCLATFQVSQQESKPSSHGYEQQQQQHQSKQQLQLSSTTGTIGLELNNRSTGLVTDVPAFALRGVERTSSEISQITQQPSIRWRGHGHRGGSTIADNTITERLPSCEIRSELGFGQESKHSRIEVQGTKPRSRASRRRERRRRAQLVGQVSQKQIR